MGLSTVMWRTLVDFGRDTSIAGLNNAARAKSRVRSAIWLIIFTVGLYYTFDGLIRVIIDYNSNPFLTSTNHLFVPSVEFPGVTVCNLNRINCLNLLDTQRVYGDLSIEYEQQGDEDARNESATIQLNLLQIFVVSGCQKQVCGQIQDTMTTYIKDPLAGNSTVLKSMAIYAATMRCG